MKALNVTRLLSAAGITAAAVLIPVAAAAPASAVGYSGCKTWVGLNGYTVGPKVSAACDKKALQIVAGWTPNPLCLDGLIKAGVDTSTATEACTRAH